MTLPSSRAFDYVVLALACLVLWAALAWIAGPDALSGPGETLARAAGYLGSAAFWKHARATGVAFGWACLLSLAGGAAIGVLIGMSKLAAEVGEPILGTLYSIPKITLYPIILLVFGLSLSAKIAFGVLHGIFPVALLTIGAIRNTKQVYLKTARVMRLTPMQTASTVLLPAILPELVTGLRIGFSSALLGTLIAELFASEEGLGFMLIRAMEAHKVVDIMALAFLLFAAAAAIGGLLLAIEGRVHRAG
jgi:NitT/TauT family transport system permease protein